jgi:hypothetical protein
MDDWPPAEARVRAALWRAEGHLERGEYAAAAQALEGAAGAAGDDEELVRGLNHLAAAGYRTQNGDAARARRQLEHARRRLQPYLRTATDVDLAGLLRSVEQIVESPRGDGELA